MLYNVAASEALACVNINMFVSLPFRASVGPVFQKFLTSFVPIRYIVKNDSKNKKHILFSTSWVKNARQWLIPKVLYVFIVDLRIIHRKDIVK